MNTAAVRSSGACASVFGSSVSSECHAQISTHVDHRFTAQFSFNHSITDHTLNINQFVDDEHTWKGVCLCNKLDEDHISFKKVYCNGKVFIQFAMEVPDALEDLVFRDHNRFV